MHHILIVEDEPIIRSALRRLLERNNYQVSEAGSVQEAQEQHNIASFDLIISDLRLPGAPGTEMIKLAEPKPVLIMTSYASLRSAVDSMRLGAIDYIAKPFDHDEMLQTVARIIADHQHSFDNDGTLDDDLETCKQLIIDNSDIGIIGSSAAMQALYGKIRKVAPTDSNVLIQGESGTGKELVARAIHNLSKRAKAPMISVNCAAIPESLIESELFGHEKGAFTGAVSARTGLVEAADGGTLFLDEIGELPLEAQARLLRVLQEGEIRRVGSVHSQKVDVRLVAATHRDLKGLSKTGGFREDLYYRLHVIALHLPALRDRENDVVEIAEILLERQRMRMNKEPMSFTEQARQALQKYSWPGNVRELENALERAVILCEGSQVTTELMGIDIDLAEEIIIQDASDAAESASAAAAQATTDSVASIDADADDVSLEDYFQRFVLANQDKMTETVLASKLGISRKCLWERRQRFGIPRRKPGDA